MKRKIDKIIVHCSATPEGRHVTAETIRQWHLDRGWSDIGYHFIIYLDGTVVNGRPIERAGAHVKGLNKHSVGVCYIGGVEATKRGGKWQAKDTRTPEQKESLRNLIEDLMFEYPDATLHGHNEFSSKACPSFIVRDEYYDLIECYE